jgi:hypothetical protein
MDSPEMQKVVIEMLKAAQLKNETTVPKKTAKKPYSPPRLVVCGKLSDISVTR